MRNTPFPWESVPDPKYYAVDTLPRKGWVKVGGWVLVVILLGAGVMTRWRIALVFGVLYALALVMEKTVAVTRRGLEIFHQMQITTNYEIWRWDEIEAVTHEPDPKNTTQTLLYFTKGDRTKRQSFKRDEAEAVLRMAKEQNPGVRVYDGQEARGRAAAAAQKRRK